MTKIILARHGQSEANINLYFAGQYDAGLTEQGRLQAELLANWVFENYKIDKIYSSDLKRAYDTAVPLAEKCNLGIIKTSNFREIFAGDWQAMPYDTIKNTYTEDWKVWLEDIGNSGCTNGETVEELSKRVVKEITRIAKENDGKTIFIATHATPIRAIMTVFQKGNISFAREVDWTPNASVTVCNFDDGNIEFELVGYNDFLENLKSAFTS